MRHILIITKELVCLAEHGYDPADVRVKTLTHCMVHPQEDPLRKFYTSLKEQRPDSAIAAKW